MYVYIYNNKCEFFYEIRKITDLTKLVTTKDLTSEDILKDMSENIDISDVNMIITNWFFDDDYKRTLAAFEE